jgi:hypothetical protein
MKMNIQHPRYKEFFIKVCDENGPCQEESILKMILYKNKYNLRSHAIKHFLNTDEFDKCWRKILPGDISSWEKHTTALKNIGCPFFATSLISPPCNGCRKFKQCTPYVSEMENIYLKGVEEVIIKGGSIPRYVSFFSERNRNGLFSTLSDNWIILKACLLEDDIFNLMTCYVKTGRRPFAEIMNNEIFKISLEADTKSIKWCNPIKWGIGVSIEHKSKMKNNPIKKPYRRGCGMSWQQQLAEMKNW